MEGKTFQFAGAIVSVPNLLRPSSRWQCPRCLLADQKRGIVIRLRPWIRKRLSLWVSTRKIFICSFWHWRRLCWRSGRTYDYISCSASRGGALFSLIAFVVVALEVWKHSGSALRGTADRTCGILAGFYIAVVKYVAVSRSSCCNNDQT